MGESNTPDTDSTEYRIKENWKSVDPKEISDTYNRVGTLIEQGLEEEDEVYCFLNEQMDIQDNFRWANGALERLYERKMSKNEYSDLSKEDTQLSRTLYLNKLEEKIYK